MPGDPYAAPSLPPGETFAAHARRDPGQLRIACLTEAPVPGVEVHPDCRTATTDTATLLTGLGHQVEELSLPADEGILHAFTRVWSVLAANRPLPPEGEELLMPLTRYLRARGAEVSGTDFARSLYAFRILAQSLADGLMPPETGYDVILTPTVAAPPVPVGGLRNDADPQAEFSAIGAFTPFTALYNATGQPAVSVPLQWNAEGLPIGVMLAGRYGDEATLIALSAQLEQARPWADRTPPMW